MRLRLASVPPLLAATLAVMTSSLAAHADPSEQDKALASSLFDQAKALLADGKVSDACRKLEESRRLDPLPGTLLNLGVCHEQEGLMASAFAELRQARALAERDHRDDRVALADQHMKAIEPKISSLVLVVGPAADVPGLTLTRDGSPIGRAAWGTRIPVDPGEHVLEATAPSKRPWKATVTVLPNGDVQNVTLASLEDAAAAPPPPPPLIVETPRPSPVAESPPARTSALSSQRIAALVVGGLGVVSVGVGTYFGVRAINDHNGTDALCTMMPCMPKTISLNNDAGTSADVSTVTIIAGLAGLGVGTFLWFWKPSPSSESRPVAVVPVLAPGRGGVEVTGSF
jgi:hypothetical protein